MAGTGESAQQSRARTTLVEDLRSVPSIHNGWDTRIAELDTDENFSPSGTVGAFQTGYSQQHKCINIWKGCIVGCWQPVFLATKFLTINPNMSGDVSTTEEGSISMEGTTHLSTTGCLPPIHEELSCG